MQPEERSSARQMIKIDDFTGGRFFILLKHGRALSVPLLVLESGEKWLTPPRFDFWDLYGGTAASDFFKWDFYIIFISLRLRLWDLSAYFSHMIRYSVRVSFARQPERKWAPISEWRARPFWARPLCVRVIAYLNKIARPVSWQQTQWHGKVAPASFFTPAYVNWCQFLLHLKTPAIDTNFWQLVYQGIK